MEYYQKRYKVILTPKSPVFIGNGKKLNKKEYIKLDNHILIPELRKLYRCLKEKDLLSGFQEFMLDSESVDLGKWLAENGVIVSENESWIDYVLDINGNKPFHANEIHCFVKNAYGKPYIPGSSLKGALRTAIFIYMVKNALESDNLIEFQKKFEELEKCKYHGSKAGIKKLGNCDKELVEEMFYQLRINKKNPGNAINDFMGAIRINDSNELSTNRLKLCKKVDVYVSETGDRKVKEINMLRESLCSTIPIEMIMSVDNRLLSKVPSIKKLHISFPELIEQSISTYSDMISGYFLNHFQGEVKPNKNTIYLGGGSGFASKTYLPTLLGNDNARNVISKILYDKFPMSHKHNTLDKKVAPHMLKCTYLPEPVIVQFGMCDVKIEEIK